MSSLNRIFGRLEAGMQMAILLGLVAGMLWASSEFVFHAVAGDPWPCVRDFALAVLCFGLMRYVL